MKRLFSIFGALFLGLVTLSGGIGPASAQDMQIDPAFSNTRIGTFGLPTLEATGSATGFIFSTTEVDAGKLHVVLNGGEGMSFYLDFMQVPDGLDPETANQQAMLMAREDTPTEGWIYGGGSYTVPGESVEFIVDLTPGAWNLAASYQPEGGDEVMTLTPLLVREASPTVVAPIEADVTLELQDFAFGISPDPVAAGPQVWHVVNTGEQPRQMVLFRTPRAFTSDDYLGFFQSFDAGTPPADLLSSEWVGYAAVASAGYETWIELDLEPGIYTATSWVIDPETQAPVVVLGMAQSFTVK